VWVSPCRKFEKRGRIPPEVKVPECTYGSGELALVSNSRILLRKPRGELGLSPTVVKLSCTNEEGVWANPNHRRVPLTHTKRELSVSWNQYTFRRSQPSVSIKKSSRIPPEEKAPGCTEGQVDALGVIAISRGCIERCCSNKKPPPYHLNLSFVTFRNRRPTLLRAPAYRTRPRLALGDGAAMRVDCALMH